MKKLFNRKKSVDIVYQELVCNPLKVVTVNPNEEGLQEH